MRHESERLNLDYEILAQKLLRLAPKAGLYESSIPGLGYARRDDPDLCENVLYPPCLGVVVQGSKRALIGTEEYRYERGQYLLCCVDMPSEFHIVGNKDTPFLTVTFRLDFDLLADIFQELDEAAAHREKGSAEAEAADGKNSAPSSAVQGVKAVRTVQHATIAESVSRERDWQESGGSTFQTAGERALYVADVPPELLNAFVRLVDLLDRPEDRPFVEPLIVREIHYYLATGPGSSMLRTFLKPQTMCGLIARTIAHMRAHCREKCRIEELARMVNMAESTFNRNFKKVTSLSPLQYHKRLKLFEARRLIRRGLNAAAACSAVGYESQQQFTREYKRLFGYPPVKDARRGLF